MSKNILRNNLLELDVKSARSSKKEGRRSGVGQTRCIVDEFDSEEKNMRVRKLARVKWITAQTSGEFLVCVGARNGLEPVVSCVYRPKRSFMRKKAHSGKSLFVKWSDARKRLSNHFSLEHSGIKETVVVAAIMTLVSHVHGNRSAKLTETYGTRRQNGTTVILGQQRTAN